MIDVSCIPLLTKTTYKKCFKIVLRILSLIIKLVESNYKTLSIQFNFSFRKTNKNKTNKQQKKNCVYCVYMWVCIFLVFIFPLRILNSKFSRQGALYKLVDIYCQRFNLYRKKSTIRNDLLFAQCIPYFRKSVNRIQYFQNCNGIFRKYFRRKIACLKMPSSKLYKTKPCNNKFVLKMMSHGVLNYKETLPETIRLQPRYCFTRWHNYSLYCACVFFFSHQWSG